MKLVERPWHYLSRNPGCVALVSLSRKHVRLYKFQGELDAVCNAMEIPDHLPDKPTAAFDKARFFDELGAPVSRARRGYRTAA
jgi:hypothetical protein